MGKLYLMMCYETPASQLRATYCRLRRHGMVGIHAYARKTRRLIMTMTITAITRNIAAFT